MAKAQEKRNDGAPGESPMSRDTRKVGEAKDAMREETREMQRDLTHEQRGRLLDQMADPSLPEAEALPPPAQPRERYVEGQRYHQVAETQEPFAGDPDDANDHFLLQKGHHLRDAEGEELSSKRKERLADNLRGRAHEAARRSAEANKEAGLTDEAEQDANARQPRKPATADQRAAEGR
jgi:hypothetical protein